jgi:hypothetical protein
MPEFIEVVRAGVLALLSAAAGAVAAEPSPTRPVGAPPVSVAGSRPDVVGVGAHRLDAGSIARLRDLGARHVRTTLYWSHWDDAEYRQVFADDVQRAADAGIELLVVVHQQPSGGYADRQRVYRDFAAFMADRAAEFPQIRYWQLWNEMDVAFTDVFGAGRDEVPMRRRGRNYAEMLALAYPAIRSANPDALVVTGGIAAGIGDGFLAGMYEGGARYDILAIHSYGFPVWPAFRDRGREARSIMRRQRDTRPLWNTEFGMEAAVVAPGWPSTPADVDRYHLDAWRESIEGNERHRIYDRIYGHVLVQGGDLGYDLVRVDGTPRPAFLWLREWLGGG